MRGGGNSVILARFFCDTKISVKKLVCQKKSQKQKCPKYWNLAGKPVWIKWNAEKMDQEGRLGPSREEPKMAVQ